MYVLIVIFFQAGSTSPNSGFSQEFTTREACHYAMAETRRAVEEEGGGKRRLVVKCFNKDRPGS